MIADLLILAWRLIYVTAAVSAPLWGGLWLAWDAKGRPAGGFLRWLRS
jgi:hypothetical protein